MSARDVIANIVVAEISSVLNDSRVKDALTENGADAILSALDKAGYAVVPKEPTDQMLRDMHDAWIEWSGQDSGRWEYCLKAALRAAAGSAIPEVK